VDLGNVVCRLLMGVRQLEGAVRYPGIEVDESLDVSAQADVQG
jgi:hypothetical protein